MRLENHHISLKDIFSEKNSSIYISIKYVCGKMGMKKSRLLYEKNKRLDSDGTICSFQILLTGAHMTLSKRSSTQPVSRFSRSRVFRRRFRLWITMLFSAGVRVILNFCFLIVQSSFSPSLYLLKDL